MATRYVPPALREAAQAAEQRTVPGAATGDDDAKQANNCTSSHVAPTRSLRELESQNPCPSLLSLHEIHSHFNPDGFGERSTLNDSTTKLNQLAYIVLHHEANPRWDPDRIIFVKSHLEYLDAAITLPQAKAFSCEPHVIVDEDQRSNPVVVGSTEANIQTVLQAIPVFLLRENGPATFWNGRFEGWFRVKRLEILARGSPELVRVLEQKWVKTGESGTTRYLGRDVSGWRSSLAHDWAVLRMEQCDRGKPGPGIEPVEEPLAPRINKQLWVGAEQKKDELVHSVVSKDDWQDNEHALGV